ncbi:MAG: hypothetical protein WBE37_24435 [Bryobacteraceae bacterium]
MRLLSQSALIEGQRRLAHAHSGHIICLLIRRLPIRLAAKQEKFYVVRVFRQNQIELLQVIRSSLRRLARIAELQRAQANPRFLAIADWPGERRCLLTGLPRAC